MPTTFNTTMIRTDSHYLARLMRPLKLNKIDPTPISTSQQRLKKA
jgi:hypothetical protein